MAKSVDSKKIISGTIGNDLIYLTDSLYDSFYDGSGNAVSTFYAYDGKDTIYGRTGNEYIDGGSGSDYINGGGGNDTLDGGAADTSVDWVSFEKNPKIVNLNPYADGVSVNLTAGTYQYTAYTNNGFNNYSGIVRNFENVFGSTGDDVIVGDAKGNELRGDTGNDTLRGMAGADYLYGGLGNDVLVAGSWYYSDPLIAKDMKAVGNDNNTVYGDDGNDTIVSAYGNDWIDGGNGFDVVDYSYLGAGFSVRYSLNGSNWTKVVVYQVVNGKEVTYEQDWVRNVESIITSVGNDPTIGDPVNPNKLDGGDGNDTVKGGDGNDTLDGGNGNDTVSGGKGKDIIDGGKGNDSLDGGDGDDTLLGAGGGNDTFSGGAGNDTLSFDRRIPGENYDPCSGLKNVDYKALVVDLATGDYSFKQSPDSALWYGSLQSIENVTGAHCGDQISGDAGNNILDGGEGGDDILYGGGGNDVYRGGAGSDWVLFTNLTSQNRPYDRYVAGGGTSPAIARVVNYSLSNIQGLAEFSGFGNTGISVDLSQGGGKYSLTTNHAYPDFGNTWLEISGVDNVFGTANDDRLIGDAAAFITFSQVGNLLKTGQVVEFDSSYADAGRVHWSLTSVEISSLLAGGSVVVQGGGIAQIVNGNDLRIILNQSTADDQAATIANGVITHATYTSATTGGTYLVFTNIASSLTKGDQIQFKLAGSADTIVITLTADGIDGVRGGLAAASLSNVTAEIFNTDNLGLKLLSGNYSSDAGTYHDNYITTDVAAGLNNQLVGAGGNDTISGGLGNDVIYGGDGQYLNKILGGGNRIYAGLGDDTFYTGYDYDPVKATIAINRDSTITGSYTFTNIASIVTAGDMLRITYDGSEYLVTLAGTAAGDLSYALVHAKSLATSATVDLSAGLALEISAGNVVLTATDPAKLTNANYFDASAVVASGATSVSGKDDGRATDVVLDWQNNDSLFVSSSGVTVLQGQYGKDWSGADVVDLYRTGGDTGFVNNLGRIVVATGDGNDTVYGSNGEDWIYAGKGRNVIDLLSSTNDGADRVYITEWSGEYQVTGFDDSDKIYISKQMLDGFFSTMLGAKYTYDASDNGWGVFDTTGSNYALNATNVTPGDGSAYSEGSLFPTSNIVWDAAYNEWLSREYTSNGAWTNESHWEAGAVGTSAVGLLAYSYYAIAGGLAMIPFVGPFIAIPFYVIAGMTTYDAVENTDAHYNATYDLSSFGAYLTEFSPDSAPSSDISSSAASWDAIRFLDFYNIPQDHFARTLEITSAPLEDSIANIITVWNGTETFVYLVYSPDAMIQDNETRLLAQIDHHVTADEIVIYDSTSDPYAGANANPSLTTKITDFVLASHDTKNSYQSFIATLEKAIAAGETFSVSVGQDVLFSMGKTVDTYHVSITDDIGSLDDLSFELDSVDISADVSSADGYYEFDAALASGAVLVIKNNATGETWTITNSVHPTVEFSREFANGTQSILAAVTNPEASFNSQSSLDFVVDLSDRYTITSAEEVVSAVTDSTITVQTPHLDEEGFIAPNAFSLWDVTENTQIGTSTTITLDQSLYSGTQSVAAQGDITFAEIHVTSGAMTEVIQRLQVVLGTDQGDEITEVSNVKDNIVFGFGGDDSIAGGNQNDTIYGGLGNDTIAGGKGVDQMTGGAGSDMFVINPGESSGFVQKLIVYSDTDSLASGDPGSLAAPLENYTVSGFDVIRDFDLAHDTLNLGGTESLLVPFIAEDTVLVTNAAISGSSDDVDLNITIAGHSITDGIITFYDDNGAAIALTNDGLDEALTYLQTYITGVDYDGAILGFKATYEVQVDDVTTETHTNSYIFQNNESEQPDVDMDAFIQLFDVNISALVTSAQTGNALLLA